MADSKIIRKLKALMAMSNDKSSEHEAMTAARQLHAMLAKHNISMDELSEPEQEAVDESYGEFKAPPWKRQVGKAIANLYFCEMYYINMGRGKARIFFVGKEANRIFAMHIFSTVTASIERDARKESRKIYGKENCSFVNSFWTGAMVRIVARCRELVNAAKEGTLEDEEGNTLPIMVNLYDQHLQEAAAFMENLNLTIRKSNTKIRNKQGFGKGKVAGDRVQLSRGLQSQSTTKLIGG